MIIGHQRQIRYLARVLQTGRIAHAYLFHGPEAVGKRTVALAVSRSLLCEHRSAGLGAPRFPEATGAPAAQGGLGGCGACRACHEVEALTHPDLIAIAPERLLITEEKRQGIGIRNIRELERRLTLGTWAGGWRVAIIDEAEALSREAQSSLLKTLEEPPRRTVFLLITASPRALLATICSRSVPMHFSPLADAELRGALSRAHPGLLPRLDEMLSLARGRPGLAVRLAREPELWSRVQAEERSYRRLLDQPLNAQFRFSQSAAEEGGDALEPFFEFCLWAFRDELTRAGRPPGHSAGPLRTAAACLELLGSTAVNRRLLADAFFVELEALRNTKGYETAKT